MFLFSICRVAWLEIIVKIVHVLFKLGLEVLLGVHEGPVVADHDPPGGGGVAGVDDTHGLVLLLLTNYGTEMTAITFINKYLHWRAKMQARYCFVTFGAASLNASKHFLLTVPSGVTISYSWVLNVSILNMALSKHWHFPSSSSSSMSLHSRENLDWEGIPTLCRNVYLTINLCYYFAIQRVARIKNALIDLQVSCVIIASGGQRLGALLIKS